MKIEIDAGSMFWTNIAVDSATGAACGRLFGKLVQRKADDDICIECRSGLK